MSEITSTKKIFFKSKLPGGYQEVEYLQSAGRQWIDTGFAPNQYTDVLYSCSVLDDTTDKEIHIFGSRTSENNKAFELAFVNNDPQNYETLRFVNGNTAHDVQTELVTEETIYNKIEYFLAADGVYVDDTEVMTFTTEDYTGDYNLWLGVVNDGGSLLNQVCSQKIYGCMIWNNGTLVRELIPCYRVSDVEPGMYDVVNNQFYSNQGLDSFIVGPDIEPAVCYKKIYIKDNQPVTIIKTIFIN